MSTGEAGPRLSGWTAYLDPARPSWPGVLVAPNDWAAGFIEVSAGSPRNFAESRALATKIADLLNHDDAFAEMRAARSFPISGTGQK